MRKLVIKDGNPPKEYPLGAGVSIGSAAGNTIQIDGGKVEPAHASVVKKGEHVWIEDLNTHSGVIVNGKKVSRWALKKDDVIEIGGTALVYIEDDKPESAPATPKKAEARSTKAAMPAKPAQSGIPAAAGAMKNSAGSAPAGLKNSVKAINPAPAKVLPVAGNGSEAESAAKDTSVSGRHVVPLRGQSGLAVGAGGSGSSSRNPGTASSSRRLTVDQSVAAAGDAALAALKERSVRANAPRADGTGTLKIVVAVLLVLVVFLSATTIYVLSRGGGGEAAINSDETAALERLKQKGPKNPQDLIYVKDKLFRLRSWEEVEALLGEPDLKFTGKISLYSTSRGTYEQPGYEFRAWYTRDPFNMAETPSSTVAPILLYQGDSEGRVTYLASKMYSRIELQPADTTPAQP